MYVKARLRGLPRISQQTCARRPRIWAEDQQNGSSAIQHRLTWQHPSWCSCEWAEQQFRIAYHRWQSQSRYQAEVRLVGHISTTQGTTSERRQLMLTLQELMFLFPITIKRLGNNPWIKEAGDLHNGVESYHATGAGLHRSSNSVHNDLQKDKLC